MSRLTRDGTAEPVSRDQILRRERGQGKTHFPCSADHEQDWQPYPVDPSFSIYLVCDNHTYIILTYHTYMVVPALLFFMSTSGRSSLFLIIGFDSVQIVCDLVARWQLRCHIKETPLFCSKAAKQAR